jgi:hypothetical protein
VISGAITLVQEAIKKYQGPEIHRKDYTSSKDGCASCDALQLGSLLRAASAIGIWPAPSSPYDGLSWKSVSAQIRDMKVTSLCQTPSSGAYRFGTPPEHSLMSGIIRQIKHLERAMEGLQLFSEAEASGPLILGELIFQSDEARATLQRLRIR